MSNNIEPVSLDNKALATIFIIVGISGDLARRKLLPALCRIAEAGALPAKYRIIGITRQPNLEVRDLLTKVDNPDYLAGKIELYPMDLQSTEEFRRLDEKLAQIETEFGEETQRLFYLSVPPQISRPIIEELGLSGLAIKPRTKLLLEKPFGVDLESAQELVNYINRYFTPDQVYRIDHYLAKETAQNILAFRQDNALFKRTWNREFIDQIEIIAQEQIGIEGRAVFYEQTGALRDLVQSHLLQLASLVLMELPEGRDFSDVPKRRQAALAKLRLATKEEANRDVVIRGQYEEYQEEAGNPGSTVETLVSVELRSEEERFKGVPIYLRTGKALDEKFSGIRIRYKQEKGHEANELILKLQPDEGVELRLFSKKPGYRYELEERALKFSFREYYSRLPEAYEQVLFSALNSDHSLFPLSEEVLAAWEIIAPIQKAWSMDSSDLIIYPKGSSLEGVLDKTKTIS